MAPATRNNVPNKGRGEPAVVDGACDDDDDDVDDEEDGDEVDGRGKREDDD